MIITLIIVSFFVFVLPSLALLSIPICLVYLIVKSIIKEQLKSDKKEDKEPQWDEFDWWQDNQGL